MSQPTSAAELATASLCRRRAATSIAAPLQLLPRRWPRPGRAGDRRRPARASSSSTRALDRSPARRAGRVDPRTLDLLDLDRDGRVARPRSSARSGSRRGCDVGLILFGADALALGAIHDSLPRKAALGHGAARAPPMSAARTPAVIRVADVADTTKVFEGTLFNGDGIIPPEAAPDLETRQRLRPGCTRHDRRHGGSERASLEDRPGGDVLRRGVVRDWWRDGEAARSHGSRRADEGGPR